MKNIILIDFVPDKKWNFIEGLEEGSGEKWEVEMHDNNHFGTAFSNIKRYLGYLFSSFKLFIRRNSYKRVLAWQQFYGIFLSFFCAFFNVKKAPEITIMTFIYKPKGGFAGKIYKAFIQKALDCRFLKRIIVFSSNEVDLYSSLFNAKEGLFVFEKLGFENIEKEVKIEDYYISAGRSNRDYEFLIRNWPSDRKLKIVCDVLNVEHSNNIEIYRNCYDDEFYELLAKSRAAVISLDNEGISSGQLVVIQSMMFSKPVICTYNQGISDYIDDGENGILIEKSKDKLIQALCDLEKEEVYKEMSRKAYEKYKSEYSVSGMGVRIGKELCQ